VTPPLRQPLDAHALADRLRRIDNRVEATVITGQCDDCEVCDEPRPGAVEITWQPVDDLRVDRIRTCAECAEYWIREWVLVVIGDPDVTPSVIEVEVYVHTAVAVPRGDAA
jgi:hypothetical protein